jgi:hypothetical protein
MLLVFGATFGVVGCADLSKPVPSAKPGVVSQGSDLSGEWEFEEEDFVQRFTLDEQGNGRYAWQDGRIATTSVVDGRWLGQWSQEGNDREGGFDVRLSEDGTQADGTWWYTRIGRNVIAPHTQGGSFRLKRVPSTARSST